jgi:putative transcriptional regulator
MNSPNQSKTTIRQLRQERGWTQADLADRLGVSASAVWKWERGLTRPRWPHLRDLVLLFGVPVAAIAFGPADQPPQERP